MRLVRDLDETNLSDQLGLDVTGQQLRDAAHKPWTVIFWILALVAFLLVLSLALKPLIGFVVGG